MTKQQITIEVDVPEGKEIEYHEFALEGEIRRNVYRYEVCVRMRDAWQWPAWLKFNFVAMDENGEWWAYRKEPSKLFRHWVSCDEEDWICLSLAQDWLDFTPPPVDDWRQSKRRRPGS